MFLHNLNKDINLSAMINVKGHHSIFNNDLNVSKFPPGSFKKQIKPIERNHYNFTKVKEIELHMHACKYQINMYICTFNDKILEIPFAIKFPLILLHVAHENSSSVIAALSRDNVILIAVILI